MKCEIGSEITAFGRNEGTNEFVYFLSALTAFVFSNLSEQTTGIPLDV